MMKKSIFLLLTLAIPVSVFLFLKFFGRNTFEVPYLYEEGIPGCNDDSRPHRVRLDEYIGKTEKNNIPASGNGFLVFAVLHGEKPEINDEVIWELVRIEDGFYEIGSPFFVLLPNEHLNDRNELENFCLDKGLEKENFSIIHIDKSELKDFLQCGLGLVSKDTSNFNDLVLVDPDMHIRGIYNSADIEQTDKLILELKILKQNI